MHIAISTGGIFQADSEDYFDEIEKSLKKYEIFAAVVGYPSGKQKGKAEFLEKIDEFSDKISGIIPGNVFKIDENFSSQSAVRTLVEIGAKKKRRRKKQSVDEVAAALILRDFIQMLD